MNPVGRKVTDRSYRALCICDKKSRIITIWNGIAVIGCQFWRICSLNLRSFHKEHFHLRKQMLFCPFLQYWKDSAKFLSKSKLNCSMFSLLLQQPNCSYLYRASFFLVWSRNLKNDSCNAKKSLFLFLLRWGIFFYIFSKLTFTSARWKFPSIFYHSIIQQPFSSWDPHPNWCGIILWKGFRRKSGYLSLNEDMEEGKSGLW